MDGSESENASTYSGMPPLPGNEHMESANSLLEGIPTPDAQYYARQLPNMSAFDCCDRSVSVWETLLPLAVSSVGGQGIDVIAP